MLIRLVCIKSNNVSKLYNELMNVVGPRNAHFYNSSEVCIERRTLASRSSTLILVYRTTFITRRDQNIRITIQLKTLSIISYRSFNFTSPHIRLLNILRQTLYSIKQV